MSIGKKKGKLWLFEPSRLSKWFYSIDASYFAINPRLVLLKFIITINQIKLVLLVYEAVKTTVDDQAGDGAIW